MAKLMHDKTYPARTVKECVGYVCELCQQQFDDDWNADSVYDVEEPKVSYRSGRSYPDGDFTKTILLDICPRCFIEKLLPWFESLGGKARQEESDW